MCTLEEDDVSPLLGTHCGPIIRREVSPYGDTSRPGNVAHCGPARGFGEVRMTITLFDPRTGRPVTITDCASPSPSGSE